MPRPERERSSLMATVQDIKRRLRSVRNTRKITKAMELVAAAIARRLAALFTEREVDRVVIVYNSYVSALTQKVSVEDVLPIPRAVLEEDEKSAYEIALEGDFIYEPEPEQILERLLPTYLETTVYRALLESAASEHGARMTAMRNASKNAGELIDRLTLDMNRARQAEITQEILEVVAGADALEA